MLSTLALAVLAMVSTTLAQTVTSSAPQATHTVMVGGDAGLVYTPSSIFVFLAKNHTVTQHDPSNPCVPSVGGFDSGFKPVEPAAMTSSTFEIKIDDDNPKWWYCQQTKPISHCGSGMIGAVNLPPNMFDTVLAAAKGTLNATSTTSTTESSTASPSDGYSYGTPSSNGASSASSTATSNASNSTSSPSPSPSPSSSPSSNNAVSSLPEQSLLTLSLVAFGFGLFL